MAAGPAYPGAAGRLAGQEQSEGKRVRSGQGEGSGRREQREEPVRLPLALALRWQSLDGFPQRSDT